MTLLSYAEAATEKGVTRQTVSLAVRRGRLNMIQRYGRTLIVANARYRAWLAGTLPEMRPGRRSGGRDNADSRAANSP